MRISDWSSDVCSSDLSLGRQGHDGAGADARLALQLELSAVQAHAAHRQRQAEPGPLELAAEAAVDLLDGGDQKSVLLGKRVAVRLGLGGRRNTKTNR